MKRKIGFLFGAIFMFFLATGGCNHSQTSALNPTVKGEIIPTVYDNSEVVSIEDTTAKDIDTWQAQVFTKSGGNNDEATENALIKSPWHTLEINGIVVPVYTARAGKGSHSFAWVDVTKNKNDFMLQVKLSMNKSYGKCVVLPESRNVSVSINSKVYTSYISEYGSYTYTFATNEKAEFTSPTLAPLTLMVTKEEEIEVPLGYNTREIEPGYHEDYELEFKDTETVYIFKKGLHEISSINIPENSIVYLQRGAYLKVSDRGSDATGWNTSTAIHMQDGVNSHLMGRGLLDCGNVKGGDKKRKHVFNASRCEESSVDGITVINSNTWTMCFYNCQNSTITRTLLLSYRTYSDGIMMSECRNCSGSYNFVRTGDDAIEFKGTGWGGLAIGNNCYYEYNDLWTDKGSGYCLTWESECDMENMEFRHNSIGFVQPIWSSQNNALDCRLGTNVHKTWKNIQFKDIEIYYVFSPNVIMTQISGVGGKLENITFENISVKGAEIGVYAYKMYFSGGGSMEDISLKNINFCGKILKASDKTDGTMIRNEAGSYFDQLSIK